MLVRSNRTRPAVVDGLTVNVSLAVAPLTSVVSLPSPPSLSSSSSPPFHTVVSSPASPRATSRVFSGLSSGMMRSLLLPPWRRSAASPPSMMSLPSPPSASILKAPSPESVVSVSSPAFMLRSRTSIVPASMLNSPGGVGVGSARSKITRPFGPGLTVNVSFAVAPLTWIVSMPSPPSLRSSSSPPFQMIVSLPASPRASSRTTMLGGAGLSSGVMRSSPLPPESRSPASLPSMMSLPSPPSTSSLKPSASRPPPAVTLSSPAFMLRSRTSIVPASMLNSPGGVGVGSARSKITRPPAALTVNVSFAAAPLTWIVSRPGPPSLRSSSSPPFQTIVSLPASPRASSRTTVFGGAGLSFGVMRSSPSPPFSTSACSEPVIVSPPPPPLMVTLRPVMPA